MSRRLLLLLAIAGLLAVLVLYLQIRKPASSGAARPTTESVPVVVAKRDIPPFTLLSPEDGETKSLPASQAIDAFGGLEDLAGRITTTEIRRGNVIRQSSTLLRDKNWVDGEMLVFSLDPPTSRVVGGQVRPGHYVDIQVTKAGSTAGSSEALWLARNLWVVGVQQRSGEEPSRPTVTIHDAPVLPTETPRAGGGGLGFATGPSAAGGARGAANVIGIAAHREIAQMVSEYVGARQYEPWIFVRPAPMSEVTGRIDGTVKLYYVDDKGGVLTKELPKGLDGVKITLRNEDKGEEKTTTTASGGKFFFDGLAPANYRISIVKDKTLEAYTPASPEQLLLTVVAGINRHVAFDYRAMAPTTTTGPGAGLVATVAPTPAAPAPTPTRAPTPASAVVPPSGAPCGDVYMSDREKGPEMIGFPLGIKEVWAAVVLKDCAGETPYTLRVLWPGGEKEGKVIATGRKGADDVVWIKISAQQQWGWNEFKAGPYATTLQIGTNGRQVITKPWSVSGTAVVRPEPTRLPSAPGTGGDPQRQR